MSKEFAAVIQCTEHDFFKTNKGFNFPNVTQIIKKSGLFQNIILAVGTNKKKLPKIIIDFCKHHSIDYYIGDKDNVLKRLINACNKTKCRYFARFLLRQFYIDPNYLKQNINFFKKNKLDCILYPIEFNYALAPDIYKLSALKKTYKTISKIKNLILRSEYQTSPSTYFEEHKSSFNVKRSPIKTKTYSKNEINLIKKNFKKVMTGQNFIPTDYNLKNNYYNISKNLVKKCNSYADISCGQGGGFVYLSSISQRSEGFDTNSQYIKNARKRYKKYKNLKFNIIKKDLDLKKKKFDLITSFHTLEHIAEKKQNKFIKTIYDSLNNNGIFIIEVPLLLKLPLREPLNPYHLHEPTLEELTRLLIKNNFKIILSFIKNRHKYVKVKFDKKGNLKTKYKSHKVCAFFKLKKIN